MSTISRSTVRGLPPQIQQLAQYANGGNADAQVKLGHYYLQQNQEQADRLAYRYFSLAAVQNNHRALFCLGQCLEIGRGVKRNSELAIHYYYRISLLNPLDTSLDPSIASYRIGEIYRKHQQYQAALAWYSYAANSGHIYSGYREAKYCLEGQGTAQDTRRAMTILLRILPFTSKNSPLETKVLDLLGQCYENLAQETSNQKHQAAFAQKSTEYRNRAGQAQLNIGLHFIKGDGVPQDHALAAKYFSRAALKGNARAMYRLFLCYYEGKNAAGQGIEKNDANALHWLRASAQKNYPSALYSMGITYESGELGIEQDLAEARAWYTRAAAYQHPKAKEKLTEIENIDPTAQKSASRKRKRQEKATAGRSPKGRRIALGQRDTSRTRALQEDNAAHALVGISAKLTEVSIGAIYLMGLKQG